ncbi:hypothetical protein V1478_014813 [Vespula squamosa]|uniref:ATP synthase F0 subunit 8 n=1 Tax=Vespula squamosa TaxID=30214 RepID=A0ABD2A5Z3_VESSQ
MVYLTVTLWIALMIFYVIIRFLIFVTKNRNSKYSYKTFVSMKVDIDNKASNSILIVYNILILNRN